VPHPSVSRVRVLFDAEPSAALTTDAGTLAAASVDLPGKIDVTIAKYRARDLSWKYGSG